MDADAFGAVSRLRTHSPIAPVIAWTVIGGMAIITAIVCFSGSDAAAKDQTHDLDRPPYTLPIIVNGSLSPLEQHMLQYSRGIGGTLSMVGGLALVMSAHRAQLRDGRASSGSRSAEHRQRLQHILKILAGFECLSGASYSIWFVVSFVSSDEAFVQATCDITLVMWLWGSWSTIYAAIFAWYLHGVLTGTALRPRAWSLLYLLLTASCVLLAIMSVAWLKAFQGHYNCFQWADSSSPGSWGVLGYAFFSAFYLTSAAYIVIAFCQIGCRFRAQRRDALMLTADSASLTPNVCSTSTSWAAHAGSPSPSVPQHTSQPGVQRDSAPLQRDSALLPPEDAARSSSSRLAARLLRLLGAYLLCATPMLAHGACLVLVECQVLRATPFAVTAARWMFTPLQGVVSCVVYWQQANPGHAAHASVSCCTMRRCGGADDD